MESLEEAVKEAKKFYVELMREEEPDIKVSEEDIPWNFDAVAGEYKKIKFTPCREDEKTSKALGVLKSVSPEVHADVADRCYVFDERYAIESCGVHFGYTEDGKMRSNIYVSGACLKYMNVNEVAASLLHEGLHIDFEKNPMKYGVKDRETYYVFKLFGLDEDRIHKAVAKTPLAPYAFTKRVLDLIWKERMADKIKGLWIEEPILHLHVRQTGKEERKFAWKQPSSVV